jgi:hypothetical protein
MTTTSGTKAINSVTCTYSSSGNGSITHSFTAAHTGAITMTMITSPITNPDTARFLDNYTYQVGSTSFTVSSSSQYTEANLVSASCSNEVTTAGSPNKVTFTFRITNAIPQNGIIK